MHSIRTYNPNPRTRCLELINSKGEEQTHVPNLMQWVPHVEYFAARIFELRLQLTINYPLEIYLSIPESSEDKYCTDVHSLKRHLDSTSFQKRVWQPPDTSTIMGVQRLSTKAHADRISKNLQRRLLHQMP